MAEGTLEVVLIGAKGLEDTDFISRSDPYAILTCRTQEKKSSVAGGQGSCPEWNQTFLFTVSAGVDELKVKLMDKDTFTADDLLGEATIPLRPVFEEGSIPPMSYNVVKDGLYCGAVRVSLKFTHKRNRDGGFWDEEENVGGWRQSSLEY